MQMQDMCLRHLTRLRRARYGGSTGRRRLYLLTLLAALVFVPAAGGHYVDYYSVTVYSNDELLAPGYKKSIAGWNTRTDNYACRSFDSGQMRTEYWLTGDYFYASSNLAWTNCSIGVWVGLDENGYFKSKCVNSGSITFAVYCESWNYHDD